MSGPRGGAALPRPFDDRSVVIAGAGCAAGRVLCRGYAAAGARVVAVDAEEAATLALARLAPGRIEALALDLTRPAACRRLGDAWAGEPLHVLVDLQPLRDLTRPAAAMAAAELLVKALAPGLGAGRGRVLIAIPGRAPDESATAAALHEAQRRFGPMLDARLAASGVAVNMIVLPPQPRDGGAPDTTAALWPMAMALSAPGATAAGAVVPLGRCA